MITLNGKKFAENETEMSDSLFTPQTCSGYAKRHKRQIAIYDIHKNKIGTIANRVLSCATPVEGGFWYTYNTPQIIGVYVSHKEYYREIKALETGFDGKPLYN